MNEVERAIESCRARHGKFLGDYQRDISDAHRRKLEKQMQIEQVKISALEKQIPKKPSFIDSEIFECPNCGWKRSISNIHFCPTCGQSIDWRNEDE